MADVLIKFSKSNKSCRKKCSEIPMKGRSEVSTSFINVGGGKEVLKKDGIEKSELKSRPQSSLTGNTETRIGSEDRIELFSSNNRVKFYKSVLRPSTASKNSETNKGIQIKEQEPSPEPKIAYQQRKSFICKEIPAAGLIRRLTMNPYDKQKAFKRQSTILGKQNRFTKKVIKPEIPNEQEVTLNYDIGSLETTQMFLSKVKKLMGSKKRCAVENDLFKNYQRLVNYVP